MDKLAKMWMELMKHVREIIEDQKKVSRRNHDIENRNKQLGKEEDIVNRIKNLEKGQNKTHVILTRANKQ
mgnify:CR=1 FL=1